ncbi:MAG: hypothetical protein K0R08_1087 [Solimicrobium sp.]|nr:hypothetical protein [Solimicrobium sp.]
MNKIIISIALLVSPLLAPAATNVGISINIGEPNYYGQIQLGNMQPRVLYEEPIIIQRGRMQNPPLYLRVPPGHYKNWSRHCGKYNACDRSVYFVDDVWYQNDFAPQYRRDHPGNRGNGNGRRYDRDDDRGNQGQHHSKVHNKGHGHGQGDDKGHGKGR